MIISHQPITHKADYTFNKNLRLLTPKMYAGVFNHTDFKIHQPNFLFLIKCQNTLPYSRLGLAITKKKIKRANQRNRVKRLCREYFRLHHMELSIPSDIVLVVKSFSDDISNEIIYRQFQIMFLQINAKLAKTSLILG